MNKYFIGFNFNVIRGLITAEDVAAITTKLNILSDVYSSLFLQHLEYLWQEILSETIPSLKRKKLIYYNKIFNDYKLKKNLTSRIIEKNFLPQHLFAEETFNALYASYCIFSSSSNKQIVTAGIILTELEQIVSNSRQVLFSNIMINKSDYVLQDNYHILKYLSANLAIFRSDIISNIVLRMQSIASEGFLANNLLHELSKYSVDISTKNLSLQGFDYNEMSYDEFNSLYSLVMNDIYETKKDNLLNIEWSFGHLVWINGNIMAKPSIYNDGELLSYRPWFSYIFRGRLVRYELFLNGYIQVLLSHRINVAKQRVYEFSKLIEIDAALIHDDITLAFASISNEHARIAAYKNKLWPFLFPLAIKVCDMWHSYLSIQTTNLQNDIIKAIGDAILNKELLCNSLVYRQRLFAVCRSITTISQDITIDENITFSLKKYILSLFFEYIYCYDERTSIAKKLLEILFSEQLHIILSLLLDVDYYDDYHEFYTIITSRKMVAATHFRYLLLRLNRGALFNNVICSYLDNVSHNSESSLHIIVQSYLNLCYLSCGAIKDDIYSQYKENCSFGKQKLYYPSTSSKVGDSYCDSLVSSILAKNSTLDIDDICLATLMNDFHGDISEYVRMQNCLAEVVSSGINSDPVIEYLVSKFANNETKYSYAINLIQINLDNLEHGYDILAIGYIEKIRCYEDFLYVEISAYYQRSILLRIQQLVRLNNTVNIDDLLNSLPKNFFDASSINDTLQDYLYNLAISYPSLAILRVLRSLASSSVYGQFLLTLLDYGYRVDCDIEEVFTAMADDLSSDEQYCWRFNFSLAESSRLERCLVKISSQEYLSGDRIRMVSALISQNKFCQYYKLQDITSTWRGRLALWQKQFQLRTMLIEIEEKKDLFIHSSEHIDFITNFISCDAHWHLIPVSCADYLATVVDLIWNYVAQGIQDNISLGSMSFISNYKNLCVKLLKIPAISVQASLVIRFVMWLDNISQYISTAPTRAFCIALKKGCSLSCFNSLCLYLYYLDVFPEVFKNKISVEAIGPYINKAGILLVWKYYIKDFNNNTDPFLLDSLLSLCDLEIGEDEYTFLSSAEKSYQTICNHSKLINSSYVRLFELNLNMVLFMCRSANNDFTTRVGKLLRDSHNNIVCNDYKLSFYFKYEQNYNVFINTEESYECSAKISFICSQP